MHRRRCARTHTEPCTAMCAREHVDMSACVCTSHTCLSSPTSPPRGLAASPTLEVQEPAPSCPSPSCRCQKPGMGWGSGGSRALLSLSCSQEQPWDRGGVGGGNAPTPPCTQEGCGTDPRHLSPVLGSCGARTGAWGRAPGRARGRGRGGGRRLSTIPSPALPVRLPLSDVPN